MRIQDALRAPIMAARLNDAWSPFHIQAFKQLRFKFVARWCQSFFWIKDWIDTMDWERKQRRAQEEQAGQD